MIQYTDILTAKFLFCSLIRSKKISWHTVNEHQVAIHASEGGV